MTLNEEIEKDFFSGELDDLFEPVKWGDAQVVAMVSTEGIEEVFDELGGATLSGSIKSFTFRRKDLMAIQPDLSMFGNVITYAARKYDVNTVDERDSHPAVMVRATLRA